MIRLLNFSNYSNVPDFQVVFNNFLKNNYLHSGNDDQSREQEQCLFSWRTSPTSPTRFEVANYFLLDQYIVTVVSGTVVVSDRLGDYGGIAEVKRLLNLQYPNFKISFSDIHANSIHTQGKYCVWSFTLIMLKECEDDMLKVENLTVFYSIDRITTWFMHNNM